jgi:hypothetical protein
MSRAEELAREVKELHAKGMHVDLAECFRNYGRDCIEAAAKECERIGNNHLERSRTCHESQDYRGRDMYGDYSAAVMSASILIKDTKLP